MIGVASERRWIDVLVREGAGEQQRIAMECRSSRSSRPRCTAIVGVSGRSIPWRATSSRQACLPRRVPAVPLQDQRDRREPVAAVVAEIGAEFEQQRETFGVQRLTRPHDGAGFGTRAHRVEQSRRANLPLKTRAVPKGMRRGSSVTAPSLFTIVLLGRGHVASGQPGRESRSDRHVESGVTPRRKHSSRSSSSPLSL